MIIPVNKKWRITSNTHCWQVERLKGKQKDGSDRWEPITYHVDFKGAITTLAERRIRLIDSSIPEEIRSAIREIRDEAIAAIKIFHEVDV